MRVKEIEIDGEKYVIAALTVGQVRAHVVTDEANPSDQWVRGHAVICCGLNNALKEAARQAGPVPPNVSRIVPEPWTDQRIADELPWNAYHKLQSEILSLSGFNKVGEARPAGEEASTVIQ